MWEGLQPRQKGKPLQSGLKPLPRKLSHTDFLGRWLKAFTVAYVVGVPVIFFMAPLARRLTARLTGINP